MTFGQRGRSKLVTSAALGAWRVAWGRAAYGSKEHEKTGKCARREARDTSAGQERMTL